MLETIIYALIFFTLIMVSVALHEVGHMVPAKLFGVKVPRYFVGFGPTIFSRQIGETEYGIKAFPLGGFVQLLGMYPPGSKRYGKPSRLMEFADAARAEEWADISEQDVADGRLIYQKKTWQKIVIMFGGPFMNILIAFCIFWGIVAGYGTVQAQPVIAYVSECVKPTGDTSPCSATDPQTPAAQAGIQVGDRIVTFNGIQIDSYAQLSGLIRANLDNVAQIVVERDGAQLELTPVKTVVNQVADEMDPTVTVPAGFLGVTPSQQLVKGGPVEALDQMWTMTQQSAVALVKLPLSVFDVAADTATGQERSASSPISIVGASRIAGEAVASDEVPIETKLVLFASLLGSINLFLAIFNLVPLPPLDGGHIAGAVYEWLRRKAAKLFSRPDPGHFDTAKLLPIAYGMGAFLLVCGVVLIVADVINPLQLF